ncbi:MAG: menaquinone biosynthesis decarboxylase [Bacteroidales bacterium]|nr:menaquinone biosynthesis decarboxylase [Bacteroidales bacterium]
MSYKSLSEFVEILEKEKELVRIKEFVNPELEITEIVDRVSKSEKGGKAILFENTGTDFPVLINAFGSYKRMCLALGIKNLDDIGKDIDNLFKEFSGNKNNLFDKVKLLPQLLKLSSWIPKIKSQKGECQQVIINNPDINKFPVLKCWPEDGGKFVTLPMVITKDPKTQIRNVGMYRMQIFGKNLTGMHWHRHKTGARHFEEYKKLGKKMPVAVVLGGDPAYTYSATAPLPDNIDEYLFAGFIRKKRVELVKCITQDIEVPTDADIIIEGYVDTAEDLILEGPFGDHTGFYSLPDLYPKFHITCITHRKNAIYHATIVGIPPQEDAWIAKATERIFLTPVKMAVVPEIIDIEIPVTGVAHNLTIVKIKKTYPGQAIKVMNALWGAGQMMFNKILVVTDYDVDIHNYSELVKIISDNFNPFSDVYFSKGPLDILDHSSEKMAFGGKLGIDATIKLEEEKNEKSNLNNLSKIKINKEQIKKVLPEIFELNDEFFKDDIPIIFISIDKSKNSRVIDIFQKLIEFTGFSQIKIIVFVDKNVDVSDINNVLWICMSNVDISRDVYIKSFLKNDDKCLVFDGTRKTKISDKFNRDWPNIIISDDVTISTIDKKWNKLGLGEFIKSPSLKYKKMVNSKGAVAK